MCDKQNIIELKNLEIGYSWGIKRWKSILTGINLSAKQGQLTAIIGQNGSGKSTLLKTISRLNNFINGDIFINSINLNKISRNDFAKQVSFVSTEPVNVSNLKVIELITLGRFPYTNWFGKSNYIDKYIVNEAIELLNLNSFTAKYFYNLSDGEKQKVMIARALAQDTEILLLDEPTVFLDLPNKFEIINILQNIAKKKNKTIIFSTHDLNIAINEADKIWLINENKITEGAPEDLMLNYSFDSFFDSFRSKQNLDFTFDKNTGNFKITKSNNLNISLNGLESHIFWTKKALERQGFKVELNNIVSTNVSVFKDNLAIKWKLTNNGNIIIFNSIYELSNYMVSVL